MSEPAPLSPFWLSTFVPLPVVPVADAPATSLEWLAPEVEAAEPDECDWEDEASLDDDDDAPEPEARAS